VGGAVRIELNLRRDVDPSDESFEPNRLGSDSAAFEADARYADHPAGLGLVVVVVFVVVGFLGVFVVRRLALAARE
jgi:hypothetical protein